MLEFFYSNINLKSDVYEVEYWEDLGFLLCLLCLNHCENIEWRKTRRDYDSIKGMNKFLLSLSYVSEYIYEGKGNQVKCKSGLRLSKLKGNHTFNF